MKNRSAAHAVLFQRRILTASTCVLAMGFLLWIVAIATDFWTLVECGVGVPVPEGGGYFLQSRAGVWRKCETVYSNDSSLAVISNSCHYIEFFIGEEVVSQHLHYERSIAAFAAISICILVMGIIFSLYTFRHTRYMYKRLAACSHVIGAGCVLIVIEVSEKAAESSTKQLSARNDTGCSWYYGFSLCFGWLTFVAELLAAVIFAVCSRKRKKDKAPDREFALDEEPTILGR